MADNCVFCRIVRGELPAFKVYEDDTTLAFLDINPIHPGHTLVISKDPASRNIFDISSDDWQALSAVVHKLANAIEKATGADGVNLLMNNRAHAGQVVDHPHVHIIPRFAGDARIQNIWRHGVYKEGEAEQLQKKILSAQQ